MSNRLTIVFVGAILAGIVPYGPLSAQTTTGTWELYPPQSSSYAVEVRPPLRPSVSTIVRSNQVPIKFQVFTMAGPVVFESIGSNASGDDDFSFLKFTPTTGLGLTFNGLYNLSAQYAFTTGNCYGGSLRWQVRVDIGNDGNTTPDANVFIYYGGYPSFTDCTSAGVSTNQSGLNMIGSSDLRYDTSQITGGTFYDSYAHAQTLVGNLPVLRASLVIDSGWALDQRLTISNVTFNDNTFVPLSGSTRTCDLPTAAIKITKLPSASVAGPVSVQPKKSDANFRVVDCMYIYNLDTNSLPGPGNYKVEAIISGNTAAGEALFTIPSP